MDNQQLFQRVFVATDFSAPAEAAMKHAVWVARSTGASITAAHVLPSLRHASPSPQGPKMDMYLDLLTNEGESLEQLELEAIREAHSKLQQLAERVTASVDVQAKVYVGNSSTEIINAVQQDGYDLVFAGTRGLAPWEQFLVGSTSKQLIQKCPSSVWIVKAEHVEIPQVVIAATDFSDVGRKAAAHGLWIAQLADAAFHLLHVIDSKDIPEDAVSHIPPGSSLEKEIVKMATERMTAFVDSLGVDRAKIHLHQAWGTPWQEIQRIAKEQSADLVVIGTVGRSGIRGLLLGNTADKVLDHCDCSILTVKPDGFQTPVAQV